MKAPDLAVGKFVDVCGGCFGWEPAGSSSRGDVHEREDLVGADLLNAFEIDAEVGSRVLNIREEPPDTGGPLVDPRDGGERRVQRDVLRATAK